MTNILFELYYRLIIKNTGKTMDNISQKPSKHQLDVASFALTVGVKAIEKYGRSYMTYDKVKNEWRTMIPYSFGAEEDLVLWAKTFINNLQNNSLAYLSGLVKDITKFLAVYTARKHLTAEKDGRPAVEYEATALRKRIWKECAHISKLREKQRKINAKAKLSKDEKKIITKQEKARRKTEIAKYNSTITNHVHELFAEARTYKQR